MAQVAPEEPANRERVSKPFEITTEVFLSVVSREENIHGSLHDVMAENR